MPFVTKSEGVVEVQSTGKTHEAQDYIAKLRAKNLKAGYCQVLLFSVFQSVCMWNVFDAYINILAKETGAASSANTWVGAAESCNGLSTLFLCVPLGWLADKMDRTKLVRLSCLIGVFASFMSAIGFYTDNWAVIFSALIVWGVHASLNGTAAEAIFADSCSSGNRSEPTAKRGMLQSAGLAIGPLMMYFMFLYAGDSWGLSTVHVPLLLGCLIGPMAAAPLYFMKDITWMTRERRGNDLATGMLNGSPSQIARRSLNADLLRERGYTKMIHADSGRERDSNRVARSILSSYSRPRGDSRAVGQHKFIDRTDHDLWAMLDAPSVLEEIDAEERRYAAMSKWDRAVPFLLTAADFTMELGAGMTVRFFPLFFINDFGVSPTQLALLFGCYPIIVALSIEAAQRFSVIIGRAQLSMLSQVLGIFMLLGMVAVDSLPLLVLIFFLRAAFQNASFPVDRSILYDYIPSSQRGAWAGVSSLLTMTWSGSAVIGGYLADTHDYRYTFIVTAAVYAVGVLIYSPLVFLVPKQESAFAAVPLDL